MLAAVCCQGDDVLALFECDTGNATGSVPVGSAPVHATVVDGRVFVATMGDRAVTVVDADGTVRTVETGVLGPSHFAVSADHVFVPCTAGDVVATLDRAGTSLVDRVPVGAEPHEITVCDGTAFVGSRRDGCVSAFRSDTREICGHLPLEGEHPRVQGVEASVVEETVVVYAVDQRNGRVHRFDIESDKPLPQAATATATVGANPYELIRADDRIYVPGRDDGTVHELDRSLESLAVHSVSGRPVDVVVADDRRWVVDRERPRLCSLEGAKIDLPHPSLTATSLGDGRFLCSHYDDHAISLVDCTTERVVWTTETPSHPFGSLVV